MSNVGGTATLIGDPPNMIIGLELSDTIGFIDFMCNLLPGVVMTIPVGIIIMVLMYPRDLRGQIENFDEVIKEAENYRIQDWTLFWRASESRGGLQCGRR